jgi:hypothetical protein
VQYIHDFGSTQADTHKPEYELTRYSPLGGICVQKYNFWPTNDSEKWSRKNYSEISPCGKIVTLITEFLALL